MSEKMPLLQVRIDKEYMDGFRQFAKDNGATYADVLRFLIDTVKFDGASSVAFDRWFYERNK